MLSGIKTDRRVRKRTTRTISEWYPWGWHENGQIRREENYKDSERVKGSRKFWNNKGEEGSNFSEAFK